jgi:RNA polymerase sigma-70 factor, ECF subfamily
VPVIIAETVAVDANFEAVIEPCGLSASQLSRLNDEQLIAHLRAGHDDALAILFDRYNRLIYTIARNIIQDEGEAEDLTQSVFFEIFRSSVKFDPARGTTKRWLLQIAYSRSLSRKHYLNIRSFYTEEEFERISDLDLGIPENGTRLNLEERRRLVQQALEMLSAPQRETLSLTFFQGLSAAEIAERRHEPEGNVRHHYYRGLKKLRSIIYDERDSSTRPKREG